MADGEWAFPDSAGPGEQNLAATIDVTAEISLWLHVSGELFRSAKAT